MRKFYWFGDSWVVGAELELTVPRNQINQHVFGALVSKHFDAEFVNCGISGSSVDILPWEFNKVVNLLTADDLVFFCLSAQHRTAILNQDHIPEQMNPNFEVSGHKQHPYTDKWYKYFDTTVQQIYNYDRATALLYFWCQQLHVRCWFLNLFTTVENTVLNIESDDAWLLPKNKCVSQFIMPIVNNKNGAVISNDMPFLTITQWQEHEENLKKYVHPGYCHPNVIGHRKIARELVSLLQNKIL